MFDFFSQSGLGGRLRFNAVFLCFRFIKVYLTIRPPGGEESKTLVLSNSVLVNKGLSPFPPPGGVRST